MRHVVDVGQSRGDQDVALSGDGKSIFEGVIGGIDYRWTLYEYMAVVRARKREGCEAYLCGFLGGMAMPALMVVGKDMVGGRSVVVGGYILWR